MIGNAQLSCLNTLVSKLNIDRMAKADMVSGFSGGRVTSSKHLMLDEATAMIKHLKQLDPDEVGAERMRKKIISLAHEMGWVVSLGKRKADMKRIDDWCVKFGYLHKHLNSYTYKELPQLVVQMENVYKSYLRDL